MIAHPEQLGEREIGQGWIAGQLDQVFASQLGMQPVALRAGPLVAPDERWPQHAALCVQHDRAMHLTGETDPSDLCGGHTAGGEYLADGSLRGPPPVFGVLLRPSRLRTAKGSVLAGRG